jgi:RimJ/RimL family protein N-acetyltransferase
MKSADFQIEGCRRGALLKDGKRWDMIYMGILLDDWMELNNEK